MSFIISNLRLKFAERTWNETFQLVRRCMEKKRAAPAASKLMAKCMERLQEVFNVSSMTAMKSRLEMIARQQGMGFHATETTCYLTADLFYLEVALLPCGQAEDVKVARHGGSLLVRGACDDHVKALLHVCVITQRLTVLQPSKSFLQLLRVQHFAGFSRKLAALFHQYNIPGDKDQKFELFACLQYLLQDLQQISNLIGLPKDEQIQIHLINNGQFGCLIAEEEDVPLTILFYISQTALTLIQAARVTVASTFTTYKLQAASTLLQPARLDSQGRAVFLLPHEVPHETLRACFLLKLQPAVPVTLPFVAKLREITDATVPEVYQQRAPFLKLLKQRFSGLLTSSGLQSREEIDERDAFFTVSLPSGVTHRYVFPGVAWEAPAQRGMLLDSVPFTHPALIPAMLELLRHQCTINTLLMSCVNSQHAEAGSIYDQHYEVLPESETSFSVTLQRPDADSLAVLLVNICDSHQICCTLCGAGIKDLSLDEYISNVMKRSMSIPVTLSELHRKLKRIPPALLPPCHQANQEVENALLVSPCATGTDSSSKLP